MPGTFRRICSGIRNAVGLWGAVWTFVLRAILTDGDSDSSPAIFELLPSRWDEKVDPDQSQR